jgi:hypothetical protein
VCLQIPQVYTHWASVALFFLFGFLSLRDSIKAFMVRMNFARVRL